MARVAAPLIALSLSCAVAHAAPDSPSPPPCEVRAYGADGAFLPPESSQVSLSRTVPESDGGPDADATRWVVSCARGTLPDSLSLDSLRPDGATLDALRTVKLHGVTCPPDVLAASTCATTEPIRLTVDFVDRAYPPVAARSLGGEVGGKILASTPSATPASWMIGAPRDLPGVGRHRGHVRFHVVRLSPGGDPSVGGDGPGAARVARSEARTASRIWGQCGVHFGPDRDVDVDVVDPPPRHLLALGCDLGLPATGGGRISLVVNGVTLVVPTRAGDGPVQAAEDVARAVRAAGLRAEVSPNARIASGALRTADVLVRDGGGALVDIRPPGAEPLSTDASLTACLGDFAPADGLTHFDDQDAAAGTLEERALVKAYADDDPETVDVFVIPSFSRTGRIGESFIDTDGSAIQNVVIVDRGAVRAGARSYALAHEVGHVLLDLPGHPDDFGVDHPFSLMDADAADATVFGPRRLSREDCARALLQSGAGSPIPMLRPWPLHPARAKSAPTLRRAP